MKVDSHQHFWQYSPDTHDWIGDDMAVLKRDFLPSDLKPLLDQNGIDGCIAVQASQSEQETEFLLRLASQHTFIRGVVGWVDLQDDKVEDRLAYYAPSEKLVGIRHIVQSEPDKHFLLRPNFLRGVSLLQQYNLSYDILIYEHQLPTALEFVKQLPHTRMVLDHIAKPNIAQGELSPWRENIQSLANYPNVYCKLSGMVTEAHWQQWQAEDIIPYLDIVTEAFGPGRLMIGSDWPVCLVAASYQEVLAVVDQYFANFSPDEKAKIYGQNAIDFYQLSST